MILFVNACVRRDSRTKRLADYYLSRAGDEVVETRLIDMTFPKVDEAFLQWRDRCIASGDYSDERFLPAKAFAAADEILIAAPHWDLSFPALLKQYLEQINVLGLTFRYTAEGIPESLCRAKRLRCVSTAGGSVFSDAYGFGYIRALAEGFYQIPDISQVCAEGLDLVGADVEGILRRAQTAIDDWLEA